MFLSWSVSVEQGQLGPLAGKLALGGACSSNPCSTGQIELPLIMDYRAMILTEPILEVALS